mmetsp:Transcript_36784/g.56326  ORF Transcript_36784/g.56326 Transcript_36784/m.56326 type:complete len:134 (+) Transcript_36784:164-565(+)|eukprot:CAMPEP_0170479468 /NCGR_PEP_ID=MMETSP0208-20121228/697_1 /TAXON_ID=197538 /ORGANISM="Strombidium inclinatum, Strain S3" /LENGTH=133 /DNA_ID=CAMNT_0010751867 /DNA_START=162 /DNA_END=563 /DNA_ORIENTATION=+
MTVPDLDNPEEQIRLMSYRYPAYHPETDKPPKGILFYVHGFTDYAGRFAHLGKHFSEEGYDFFAMDSRGHGKSEGHPGYVESVDRAAREQLLFQKMVLEKYYPGEKPPIHVFAHSFGCMQTMYWLTNVDLEVP